MAFDLKLLGNKIKKYREQLQVTIDELSAATGIPIDTLYLYESGQCEPTGDDILIIADYFKCDYKYFISNEKLAPFEETELLFRKHGVAFSKEDRWSVQEVLYLAECETYLMNILGIKPKQIYKYHKRDNYFKKHGIEAAIELRRLFNYHPNQIPINVYDDFRSLGIHIFRRKLNNSNISGLYIQHPIAGKCILVNYNEDVYRQRFTVAHEVAHSIFDEDKLFVVSFTKWDKNDLVEIRANAFASHYLLPPEFIANLPDPKLWTKNDIIIWANKLRVSTSALANALYEARLIDEYTANNMKKVRVPYNLKQDPELSDNLSPKAKEQKLKFLQLGLSGNYVKYCFEAYRKNFISARKMAEMLLISEHELIDIAELFGEEL